MRWLRGRILSLRAEEIRNQFSPTSPLYEREIDTLRALYEKHLGV